MASLGQELKNLGAELKKHRVNAVEGNEKSFDPNQKGRENATSFLDTVEPMVTLSISVETKYEMRRSRICKMKPQPKKRLRSPKIKPKTWTIPRIWELD